MSQTEQERILYDAREKAIRDEVSRNSWYEKQWSEGFKNGQDQGLKEGIKEGIEEGMKIGQDQWLKEGRKVGLEEGRELFRRKAKLAAQINRKELGLMQPISPVDELVELSEEELMQRLNELEPN